MSKATHLGLGLMEIVQKYKYLDVKIEMERNPRKFQCRDGWPGSVSVESVARAQRTQQHGVPQFPHARPGITQTSFPLAAQVGQRTPGSYK